MLPQFAIDSEYAELFQKITSCHNPKFLVKKWIRETKRKREAEREERAKQYYSIYPEASLPTTPVYKRLKHELSLSSLHFPLSHHSRSTEKKKNIKSFTQLNSASSCSSINLSCSTTSGHDESLDNAAVVNASPSDDIRYYDDEATFPDSNYKFRFQYQHEFGNCSLPNIHGSHSPNNAADRSIFHLWDGKLRRSPDNRCQISSV